MDARLVKALRMSCPSSGGSSRVVVPFDVSTPFQFDHSYYANLQARLGLLASDQAARGGARRRQSAVLPGLRGQHGPDGLHPDQEGQGG
jgi:peroxidase